MTSQAKAIQERELQHNFLLEDFGESDDDKESDQSDADEEGNLPKEKARKIKPQSIDKLSQIYRFLLNVTAGLSPDQVKNVHQNPL